ncbi:hypothetical protein WJX72_001807 [[Myrmecia] bisecta]|uniref:RRM domain-containing protein n=1 Tax=[Myrmecia] bisecta TaxID=41462 RepID=A0AAW1QP97_9CHLO
MSRGGVVFVGNLPGDCRKSEVEELFSKYGRVTEVDLKLPPRPPGFAFVEFDDPRDAEDAVRGRDGYDFYGNRLRVELARGGVRRGPGGPPRDAYGGGGGYDRGYSGGGGRDRGYGGAPPPRYGGGGGGGGYGGGGGGGGGRGGGPSKRSDYRVMVTGLPKSASWQDLKDHMRKAGEVTFAQVFRDRDGMMGIVDYSNKEDMKYALRKLDDSEFKNPFDKAFVRVKEDKERSHSRSRSPDSRSRSRSRGSPSRSRSRSRSKSASRSKSRSASPRSKSRSPSRSKSPEGKAANGKDRSASRSPSKSPARSKSKSPAASD